MKHFNFYMDTKITMWVREYHHIEAETQEEANAKFIHNIENHDQDTTFYAEEKLYDTMEYSDDYVVFTEDGGQIYQNII